MFGDGRRYTASTAVTHNQSVSVGTGVVVIWTTIGVVVESGVVVITLTNGVCVASLVGEGWRACPKARCVADHSADVSELPQARTDTARNETAILTRLTERMFLPTLTPRYCQPGCFLCQYRIRTCDLDARRRYTAYRLLSVSRPCTRRISGRNNPSARVIPSRSAFAALFRSFVWRY
jgi:hypothetical protein